MRYPPEAWTQFHERKVTLRDPIIELKTGNGLSTLRDRTSTTGSGAVDGTVGSPEFVLTTTANGADSAVLESAEIARYVPGFIAETGIGIRVPAGLTGSQVARWGYFDADNGFGFGVDANGLFVFVRRGGDDTVVRQDEFIGDRSDGDDESRLMLDLARGNIFQINFAWYGYGTIEFFWVSPHQGTIRLHSFAPSQQTSIADPNQPIRAEIDNNGTAESQTLYVAGRQFSLYGMHKPNRRITSERRLEMGSIGNTLLPAVSFRRKDAYSSTSVKIAGVEIVSGDSLVYEIRSGADLTGASYGTPTNTNATETAVEADVSATAISGGDLLYAGLVNAAQGNAQSVAAEMGLDFDFARNDPVTVCLRKLPSGTAATASVILRLREEW